MHKQIISLISVVLISSSFITAQEHINTALNTINRNTLEAELGFISSDWFEGREATKKGAFMAADYLASLYQAMGIQYFNGGSYLQDVPLLVAKQPKEASITYESKNRSNTYTFPTHFRAERVPQSYNIEGSILWGGFGINNASLQEISLKNTEGKILIRLSGLPEAIGGSDLEKLLKTKSDREWMSVKNEMLQNSGVLAVLEYDLSNPYLKESFETNPNIEANSEKKLTKRSSGIYDKSLFLQKATPKRPYYYKVSKQMMEDLIPDFEQSLDHYLAHLQNLSTKNKPQLNYTSIELNTIADVQSTKCQNVIAMIEGSEKPNEIIVVGAHYDHLGTYDGYIWNGADDNGSGAIGVVAIARAFMATGIQPKRTVIFANWTAEERGLFGSRHFVNTFKNIKQVKYYHNYDMIGRSNNYEKPDSAVALLYTKSWKQAEDLCHRYNTDYKLGLKINFSGWDNPTSGSDNAPFAQKGIPIMWFHTGGHESYHMPSDHVDRIDWHKFEAIVKTSFLTLWNLANE
ncbi:MAG: M20/M25/M40 family metallo-hydrolase [Carboxylicivirga sp.]|jgi:hypothetical protein|nr:M20/M25/M40 family metallo-hydrolase [Carboxylicivirga sp.]